MSWELLDDNEVEQILYKKNMNTAPREPQKEGLLGGLLRNTVGAGASLVGGLASVPRSVADIAWKGAELLSDISPEEREAFEAKTQMPGKEGEIARRLKQGPGQFLPSAQGTKDVIGKALPEGYLEPQSETAQAVQEFASDIGSLMFPGLGGASIGKAALQSGLGNAAKYLTKNLGASEGTQDAVKIGTMLLTSLGQQEGLRKLASDRYNEGFAKVSPTQAIPAKPVKELARQIEHDFSEIGLRSSPQKRFMKEVLTDLDGFSSGDNINLRNLIAFKKDLNEPIQNALRSGEKELAANLIKLQKGLNTVLKKNPDMPKDIAQYLIDADHMWSSVARSEKAMNFIKDNLSKVDIKKPFSLLNVVSAGKKGVGTVVTEPYNIVKDVFTKPAVRDAYLNMWKGALKQQKGTVIKNAQKIEKLLGKEESEEGRWVLED